MADVSATTHLDYSALRARWGVCVDAGLLIMPDTLLRQQVNLDLTSFEVVLLLNIIVCWNWQDEGCPRVATSTLATRLGTTSRTVQRALQRLAERGYIRRLPQKKYDLSGLVAELQLRGARDLRAIANRGRRLTHAA